MMGAATIANDMMCKMCFDYTDQQITLEAKQLGRESVHYPRIMHKCANMFHTPRNFAQESGKIGFADSLCG